MMSRAEKQRGDQRRHHQDEREHEHRWMLARLLLHEQNSCVMQGSGARLRMPRGLPDTGDARCSTATWEWSRRCPQSLAGPSPGRGTKSEAALPRPSRCTRQGRLRVKARIDGRDA